MKIAFGCDHGGIGIKDIIISQAQKMRNEVNDQGCYSTLSVHYPDFTKSVCELVRSGRCDRGILICGTGIGMSMAANRFDEIRAALCHELYTARMSREHNNANMLCLGARVIGPDLAVEIVRVWLSTEFAGGRHQQRLDMF